MLIMGLFLIMEHKIGNAKAEALLLQKASEPHFFFLFSFVFFLIKFLLNISLNFANASPNRHLIDQIVLDVLSNRFLLHFH